MANENVTLAADQLDSREAMGEVIDAAQLYLSVCDPATLAIIPRRCMPYPLISAEDVELYAHKLRKECLDRKAGPGGVPPELEAMREFFSRAARAIYLLRIKTEGEGVPVRHGEFRQPDPLGGAGLIH